MIRPAVPADVPAILALIRELADYEREPDAVETTEADLHAAFFGPSPAVFALVAVDETDGDAIVGTAVWFVNFSTWTGRHGLYLEDFVVSERVRGRGFGKQLFTELIRICRERGYPRLDFSVLDWNESAHGFYRAIGAQPMTEWTGWRLSGDALVR